MPIINNLVTDIVKPIIRPIIDFVTDLPVDFLPTDVSGLQVWFDASDLTTIISSGNAVSGLNDKSINNNNSSQLTGASQPQTGIATINGLNVLTFPDSNDFLNLDSQPITGTTARTIIVVGFADTSAGNNVMVTLASSLNLGERYQFTAEIGLRVFGANSLYTDNAVESGVPAIMAITNGENSTLVEDVNNLQVYKDGALISASSQVSPSTLINTETGNVATISTSSLGIRGNIGEVIIYNKVVSSEERESLDNYLSDKWGIALT